MNLCPNYINKIELQQIIYPESDRPTWFVSQDEVDAVLAKGMLPEIKIPVETAHDAPRIGLLLTRDKHPAREKPDYSLPQATVDSLVLSGGNPCAMSYEKLDEQLENIKPQGIFLPGGDFALPKDWSRGVQVHTVNELRVTAYIKLLQYAKDHKLPLLGVCAGMQMLSGFCGAKLQKVEGHRIGLTNFVHHIKIPTDSKLKTIIGAEEIAVNSQHHFAVKAEDCGDNEVVLADDGVVEFILPKQKWHDFVLGVQSHPEYFVKQGYLPSVNLFKYFVKACKNG